VLATNSSAKVEPLEVTSLVGSQLEQIADLEYL